MSPIEHSLEKQNGVNDVFGTTNVTLPHPTLLDRRHRELLVLD